MAGGRGGTSSERARFHKTTSNETGHFWKLTQMKMAIFSGEKWQVEAAARLANAHDFIVRFPDG